MIRFIKFILVALISVSLVGCGSTIPIAVAYEVTFDNIAYNYNDCDILLEKMEEEQIKMDAAHQMAEGARTLGYDETHEVIQLAQREWAEANERQLAYREIYNGLKSRWAEKETEYPVAAYIWSYFKDLGYSDYVCAGIMGNLMIEVGGQTLALQHTARGRGYYGICQWNKAYTEVWGASLEEQCAFLRNTIKYELDTYGYAYKRGFNYNAFMSLTDCQQAALAFAKCYERCGSGSYSARQRCAVTAYNYFVS